MLSKKATNIGYTVGWIWAIAVSILCFVLGVLALIPYSPFDEQSIEVGVVLIMFALTGVIGLGAGVIGFLIGLVIGILMDFLFGTWD